MGILHRWVRRLADAIDPAFGHDARIGSICVGWAYLEKSLDLVNAIILHGAGGHAIQADLPVSLKAKLAFFKKAHNQLATLADFRVGGGDLAARVVSLKDKRHDCIHGFAHPPFVTDTHLITRVTYDGASIGEKQTPYTNAEMDQLALQIAKLAWNIASHGTAILTRYPIPDDALHHFSQLAVGKSAVPVPAGDNPL